ncbi:lysylphosphatidylglycerol synthase transmembrane domain-containing protein [Haloarcula amylolytica]|jgi:uncharacterized protein (TIRG00374 family)|uniref:lysylphosphatidylglycerol synthase transmembrane domain-containing protein n=1 Tax=Haloarcula amylolytica TaxID=396317 RepID=UPI003C71F0D3
MSRRDTDIRSILSASLRVSISVILLWYVISRVGFDTLIKHLQTLEPVTLVIAVGLSVLGVGLSAWKWRVLLAVKGITLTLRTAWIYYYIGQFFNAFLPSIIGGDTARMYYLYADTNDGSASVSSVVIERIAGLYSILCIVLVAVAFGYELVPVRVANLALIGCAVGIVTTPVLLFTDLLRPILETTVFELQAFDIGNRAERLYTAVYEYRQAKRAVVIALLLSVVFRVLLIASNYVVALGLGIEIPLVYFFVFIPLVELFLFLPISIQGFGVRESAYLYLFTSVGVGDGVALTFGVVMQLILRVINNIIGGVVYAVHTLRS